jgi:hypothetical protein
MRNDDEFVSINLERAEHLRQYELEKIMAVSLALHGVRLDLEVQEIAQVVADLFSSGHGFDEIGMAVQGLAVDKTKRKH